MNQKKLKVISLFISIYQFFQILLNFKIKVCLCTIGRNENLYVREFTNYYQRLGIDKIFIYDNNKKNGEKFDLILKDYIDKGFVHIIDFRGKYSPQMESMEDCRKQNFKNYDWLLFFDLDEYLYLRNFSNIKEFLNQKHFEKCQRIHLNWYIHTDNNLLYYDNRTLKERFPNKKIYGKDKNLKLSNYVKSILKGNIDNKIMNPHDLNPTLIGCNGFGKIENTSLITNSPDFYYYYIDHYYSKSTEEFANKISKGDVNHGFRNDGINLFKIKSYFSYNKITKKKIDYIEKKTKYNLTKYKLIIEE